jgi:hypothetical protein
MMMDKEIGVLRDVEMVLSELGESGFMLSST